LALITVKKAKKILGKRSDGRVYDLVARGLIPPGPLVRMGREIKFNEEKLIEWVEAGGSAATPSPQNNEAQNQGDSSPAA
jgi:hypothetical protein